jgi:hypothetical protein
VEKVKGPRIPTAPCGTQPGPGLAVAYGMVEVGAHWMATRLETELCNSAACDAS